jgi:UDP-4-amino-4,6-dideoxy-N-acetyl-beta-L-altrosamine transaminase
MPRSFLPYGRQQIDDADVEAVVQVLRSDMLTTGPAVSRFEAELCKAVQSTGAVACSSGTAALHIAAIASQWSPGVSVVVPSVTFVATANCARYVGADVVFADVDPDTGLMTPDTFGEALDRAPSVVKGVLPVHLGGRAVDIEAVARMARAKEVVVVEDACHAIGTTCLSAGESHAIGECHHSDMCVFSFHPVKTIAMGEGGAVTFNQSRWGEALLRARNHGLTRDPDQFTNTAMATEKGEVNPWYYEQQTLGFNYRASDLHCALGLSQLSKMQRFISTRQALSAHYDSRLRDLGPQVRSVPAPDGQSVSLHLYTVLIDFDALDINRGRLMGMLTKKGIGTQVHYIPVHHQPYHASGGSLPTLPGADAYYRRCLSLPLHTSMTASDVDFVVDTLAACLGLG